MRYTRLPHRVICHESNETGFAKINVKINSVAAVSSFLFSDSIIAT